MPQDSRPALSGFLVLLACARLASADVPTADALYKEAIRLDQAGKVVEACRAFEQSLREDPSAGTAYNLGHCFLKLKRTASAWAAFTEARALGATQQRPAERQNADREIRKLEPLLGKLAISAAELPPGLVVERDGKRLALDTMSVPVAVDPGSHALSASAPGRVTWSQTIEVPEGPGTIVVPLPKMAPLPDAPSGSASTSATAPPSPAPPSSATEPSPRPTASSDPSPAPIAPPKSGVAGGVPTSAYVSFAAGGVGLVAGGVFAALSKGSYGEAEDACPARTRCPHGAIVSRDRAETQAWVANGGLALGVVGVGIGTYLVLTRRGPASDTVRLPSVDVTANGALLRGRF